MGRVSFDFFVVAAEFLSVIGIWDVFSTELMENMLPVEFARATDSLLCRGGMVEAGLDHLGGFVRKMKCEEIAGGGFDTDAFLVGEACR
jgi:hypothetical protein